MSKRRRSRRSASSLGVLPAVVPFVAPVVAMVLGLLIGATVGWYGRSEQSLGEIMAMGTPRQLERACEPVVEEQKNRLTEIRQQLAGLEGEVAAKELEVDQLRTQLEAPDISPEATAELESALAAAKEGLAEVRHEVRSLRRTKDQLVDQLSATQAQLERTESDLEAEEAIREALQSERSALIEQAVTSRWLRMITESQLDICERVGRRRRESCRETVVGALKTYRREFVHCVRSNEAVPSVHPLDRNERLPPFSFELDPDDRFLDGWYLQLCDPTLPERPRGTGEGPDTIDEVAETAE